MFIDRVFQVTAGMNGMVLGSGSMADGSTMTMTAVPNAPSLDGRLPFYGQAWMGTRVQVQNRTNVTLLATNSFAYGTALGWLQVGGTNITGDLTWAKKNALDTNIVTKPMNAAVFTNYYTNGFTNVVTIMAESYVKPALNTRVLSGWTNGLISFSGDGLWECKRKRSE